MFIVQNGILTGWDGDAEAARIPDGVTTIGKGAFSGRSRLRRVALSDGVRTIGDFAFAGCGALEAVELNEGLKRLGNGCFRECASLRTLELPETVASIHANAFENDAKLAEIRLPEGMRRNIEARAFANCVSLLRVAIPAGVQQVRRGAFAGCTSLEEVAFANPELIIDPTAFDGCGKLSAEARAFIESHVPKDDTVDINSRAMGAAGRLSNYTPRRFVFDGVECGSIEGVLQGLKCPDIAEQRRICLLAGGWAKEAGSEYDWRAAQTLYWQGKAYPRRSNAYAALLDRLYDAVYEQDEAFRSDLASLRGRKIDHRMGMTNPADTVLTRLEFVRQLRRLTEREKESGEGI